MRWTRYDRRCSTGAGNSRALARFAPERRLRCRFVVVDEHSEEIEPFSTFLRDLMLTDMSPLTARSYGNDLLRWWRLLQVLGAEWDLTTRADVEVLVGWMRSADNPQRRRRSAIPTPAGSVNQRTGKRALRPGYAPATINHALSVVSAFYAYFAACRVLQRANGLLGTDWTLHDLRRTTIERMTAGGALHLAQASRRGIVNRDKRVRFTARRCRRCHESRARR